jgi:succinyl-diaminopimelate desuccinylase
MTSSEALRLKIDAWYDAHREALLRDLGRLVAVKSFRGEERPGKPYGDGPAAALREASAIFKGLGFEPVNHDNRVVTADLNGEEPALDILAHLDTVEAGDGWTSDPFKMDIREGKIFGRGVIDNKGPAAAAMYALKAARDIMPGLKKGCRVILGSAEETGHDDLTHYRKTNPMPPNVFTPDAGYPLVNVEKGRFVANFGASWPESRTQPRVVFIRGGATANVVPGYAEALVEGLPLAYLQSLCVVLSSKMCVRLSASYYHDGVKIKAGGKAAHAACPEEGCNAQSALLEVLAELPLAQGPVRKYIKALRKLFPFGDTAGKALGIDMADDISGSLTLNFGVLSLNETGFNANFDARTPKCAAKENLDDVVIAALKAADFEIRDISKTPFHHTPADAPLVRALLRIYETYTGSKGRCLAIGGQTYVHDIDGGVAFGPEMPGADNRLHGADEHIDIEELILGAKMYTQAIIEMCS